jgi:uncharacterized membrane protein YeaQ/YmgE (transglycosylase-associated protein family)
MAAGMESSAGQGAPGAAWNLKALPVLLFSCCILSCRCAWTCQQRAQQKRRQVMVVIEPWSIVILLLVGLIAGWLASLIVRGGGFGVIGDIIVGIIGAFFGTWLLAKVGIVIGGGILAAIINATIGAIVLLLLLRLIKRA